MTPRRRPLTVYGGWAIHYRMPRPHRNQVRAIIAAPSKAAARRAAAAVGYNLTARHMSDYWAESGNTVEVAVAMASPETLLFQPMDAVQQGHAGTWLPWSWDWPA